MINRIVTQGIVLSRTDFGEADRILTFLTPDHGKVRAIAKGVRKTKSKLAGGIELFSISDLTFLIGRSEINTLMSSRLAKHYANIVKNLERTNAGYEIIKLINRVTEDAAEAAYFDLLKSAFAALDDDSINLELVRVWFSAQLLRLAGHTPNLRTDASGKKLQSGKKYEFNFDTMGFQASNASHDSFNADQIKFLRIIFSDNQPKTVQKVQGADNLAAKAAPLVLSMLQTHIRI
ncbi:MAG: DNA repair protein RecO [Candidatus Saccharimonadales bacterium]|jgi:DNA repair protein RecO (recombination protein O)